MNKPLHILHLEDESNVVDMVKRMLAAEKLDYHVDWVETKKEFVAALEKGNYDLILADYLLPNFDGLTALSITRERNSDVPFILFSGSIGEEKAIESLKNGATDYVLKQNITALVPAILRALKEAEEIVSHKKAQESLEKANLRNEQLLSSISSILIVVDINNNIISWNKTAEKVFGIHLEKVFGQELLKCGINWDWDEMGKYISDCRLENRTISLIDFHFIGKDNKDRFLNLNISPFLGEDTVRSGFLILGEETTEHKLMESQLVQAQKLESIGQLAAGIAHEINTPTQYVSDNTRFLQEANTEISSLIKQYKKLVEQCSDIHKVKNILGKIKQTEKEIDVDYLLDDIPDAIEQSLEGIDRITKIVKAMKEFSHPGTEDKMQVDINKALENTVTISKNEWKYIAEITTEFEDDILMAPCLLGELNQVFLNIIVNAAHAISDKLGKDCNKKGQIKISTKVKNGCAEICISDTGKGLPDDIKNKVFDPFFTTKEIGKGTGQGLAISHNVIVNRHFGTIELESEVGKGTTFIIKLPLKNNKE